MKYNFIAIEGNIGSGKTTLAGKIACELNSKLILEQFADNPFLSIFYRDGQKHAFPLELSFLAERYQQLKLEWNEADLENKTIVSDYHFYKSLIFAKVNLKEEEFNLYSRLFNIVMDSSPKPDLLVYLHLDISRLQKNILKRGRSYELNISNEYLVNIQLSYLEYLKQQKDLRILLLDINNIDFVNNPADCSKLMNVINGDYTIGINRIAL